MDAQKQQMLATFVPLIILFVAFYFMLIRPQKKRESKVKDMRAGIKVGDEIMTIGGIKGKVVLAKEDYVVIETSGEKSRIEVMKWGINSIVTDKTDLKAE
ncbi:preprotein translocase subunit YajC [Peptoniphilus stercorisuis]|nr:preprotein translocase subunit YajC [Peptoniphilus stercorisuis]